MGGAPGVRFDTYQQPYTHQADAKFPVLRLAPGGGGACIIVYSISIPSTCTLAVGLLDTL